MKVYLAGPDVFLPDAAAQGARLRVLCAEYGFVGCYPLDGDGDGDGDGSGDSGSGATSAAALTEADAHRIYQANIALIRSADVVMANLQNFRGYEPDSGTAFEVGFAAALRIPVWGYNAPSIPIVEQVPHATTDVLDLSEVRDADGYLIESFGMSRNLMLACSARLIDGDVRACLADMRHVLLSGADRTAG